MLAVALTADDAAALGVALAVGLLLGLQRERMLQARKQTGLGGARTYPIVALLGGMSVHATGGEASWLTAAGLVGVAALLVVGYVRTSAKEDSIGLTSEALLLLAYVLGAAAVAGHEGAVAVVGAAALVLAGLKERLHRFAGRLTDEDETAFLKFTAVALLVLPLLPDRDVGPYGAVNPFDLGRMTVLVAAVSLLGYVAVKTVGAGRGLLVTGFLGGLVSSTATTAALARRSREASALSAPLSAGALAGCTVLYPRVLALVAVLSPGFAAALAPRLAALGAVTLAAAVPGLLAVRRARAGDVPLENPFHLLPAVLFALVYGAVGLAAAAAHAAFGDAGLLATAGIAGLTDMDAVSLTSARLDAAGETGRAVLTKAVLLAAVANALVKAAIALAVGSRAFGVRVAVGLLASAAVGAGILLA